MTDNKADASGKVLPIQAHHLKKGHFVMMKGHPCKVMTVSVSKTGKHGHAKVTYQGVDVLTGKKYSEVQPGHANCLEPVVEKREYTLMDIDEKENSVAVMDSAFNQHTLDCDFTTDLGKEIVTRFRAEEELVIGTLIAPVGEDNNIVLQECLETIKNEKASKTVGTDSKGSSN